MDSIENAAEERMRDHFTEREKKIQERAESVHEDNRRKESLLNEILPKSVTDRLLRGEQVATETYDAVTVFFSDIVGEYLMLLLYL